MSCAEIQGQLVAYGRNELSLLQATRVEQHLLNCAACARLKSQLSLGFEVARRPLAVDRTHLLRLIARLDPYLEGARPARSPWAFGLVGAAGALALVVLALGIGSTLPPAPFADPSSGGVQRSVPRLVQARYVPRATRPDWLEEPSGRALLRSQPVPALELLTSPGWSGRVEGADGPSPQVVMEAGFASFDFAGGPERSLTVVAAPDLQVELRSARIYVVTDPQGLTTIGLLSGRATVRSHGVSQALSPGAPLTFPAPTPEPAANPPLDRPTLRIAAAPVPARVGAPTPAIEPPSLPGPAPSDPPTDLRGQLAAAERRSLAGDRTGAEAEYQRLLVAVPKADQPIVQYELARLYAEVPERRSEATDLYRALSQGEGEIGLQASFALCELARQAAPCQAAQCLGRLSTDLSRPATVRQEAVQLRHRWGLSQIAGCRQ